MIEINLLPEELKVKAREAGSYLDYAQKAVPAALALLVLTHLIAAGLQVTRSLGISGLNRQLAVLEPQRKQIELATAFEKDPGRRLVVDAMARRVPWSRKLEKMSEHLPPGVWFTEIVVGKKDVSVRGSAFSLEGNQIDTINRFLTGLRGDKDFMKDFTKLELGPLTTKTVGTYEVVDYLVIMTRKITEPAKK